jgi:hypothetical protein
MGTEFVAVARVQGAFEESAEDGGLDVAPVLARGEAKEKELRAIDGQNGVIRKEAAVEAKKLFAKDGGVAGAGVHLLEELLQEWLETGAIVLDGFQEFGETAIGQEADILGEHAEEAAAEKFGNCMRGVTIGFEGFSEFGEVAGDFASDFGGLTRGVEREWIGPDEAEALAGFLVAKVGEADAEMRRVGKREVGFTGLGEIGVNLEAFADIDDD